MNIGQIAAFITMILVLFTVPFLVALFYFVKFIDKSFLQRASLVAPSLLFILATLLAMGVSLFTENRPTLSSASVYVVTLLFAIALVLSVINFFRVKSWLHLIQFFNWAAGVALWAVSAMAITHDWL